VNQWNLLGDAHCIDQFAISGGLTTSSASASDPVTYLRHLNDVPAAGWKRLELALSECAETANGIWIDPVIMVDNIGKERP
jgi:hypothetical protein